MRLDARLAAAALVALVALTISYQTIYLAIVPAAYLAVYLGMMHPPKRGPLFSGDYSYGLYLFAFPIQQAYTHLFPDARHWWLNAGFTIVAGLSYAAFSWWCVEKPLLSRKRHIVAVAEVARDRILHAFHRKGHGHVMPVGERIG